MTTNTGDIAQLLRPGLQAVFGDYAMYPDQWTEIYKTYASNKYQEIDVEMRYLGAADIQEEGAPVSVDVMGQRIVNSYVHRKVSNSFIITDICLQDNLYQSSFPQQAKSLRNSLRYTKNVLGASILNNAFNAAYTIGDGQPVCSINHPIDGAFYANRPTGGATVDLSEAGIEEAIIQIQKFPMQSGILAQIMPEKMIVSPDDQFAISRILDSTYRVETANNDISSLNHNNYIPKGYKVNQYLNSSAWFILTDADNGFKHFQRTSVEVDTYVDFSTSNIMAKAAERYSFGISNPRAVWGSPGV